MLVGDLIQQIPSDTRQRVTQARQRYNQVIREAIRAETRLTLRPAGPSARAKAPAPGVRIRIDLDGCPEELASRTIGDEERLAAMLALWRAPLTQLKNAARTIASRLDPSGTPQEKSLLDLLYEVHPGLQAQAAAVTGAHAVAETLLLESQKIDLVQRLLAIDRDVLGEYRYKLPRRRSSQLTLFQDKQAPAGAEIRLHWAVIGLVAMALGVSVEDLTAVVLAHELAHAYTHIGYDINGACWDSWAFDGSDHALREGLAQYYTALALASLQRRIPGGRPAYERLLDHQPEAYRSHLPWMTDVKPETVRTALVTLRSAAPVRLETFEQRLKDLTQRYR